MDATPTPPSPGQDPDAQPDALDRLLEVLELRHLEGWGPRGEEDVLRGASVPGPANRAYGGQVLAQAILAADRTVPEGRLIHSLHGYFLREGRLEEPIDFAVERLRDGRSFSARRTHAIQFGKPILSMIASFQEDQPGYEHHMPMPQDVPPPEEVGSAFEELADLPPGVDARARFWADSAFELRHVGGSLYLHPDTAVAEGGRPPATQLVWMRTRRPLAVKEQSMHRALLAFACDQLMLEPALRAAGKSWQEVGASVPMASLDHGMWWHRDVHVDEWMLFVQTSPTAQGGRALGTAGVYQDGVLVASAGQEGMIRLPA
ncbi:acyl-CoA thioesterase [Promicromonospora citrea]|uniref:Acyl-CoA thioesterase II n=1 Tax=Promicromonospora citrea TaxID=43677 RepID=A0A8H9L3Z1_9MICO|nr:acyl-CoA thioesterase domain-containing protein [Promicromonospora citrea]NNH54728.1 acyl-CoA thioesterase II [Promicromonospora citrea]GGM30444.1 acyl-CoA thioesterase II [Promicromonospora citrea]